MRQASARSRAAASAKTSASAPGGPAICRPTGSPPAVVPQGSESAGWPVTLNGDGVGVPLEGRRASTRGGRRPTGNASSGTAGRVSTGETTARTGASASSTRGRAAARGGHRLHVVADADALAVGHRLARRRLELLAALGRHDLAQRGRLAEHDRLERLHERGERRVGPRRACGPCARASRAPHRRSRRARRPASPTGRVAQHADAQRRRILGAGGGEGAVVRRRDVGVARLGPRHHLEHERAFGHGARHRAVRREALPGVVGRGRAAHEPARRLVADDAAAGRGDADRAAAVRALGERADAGGERRRRAAARAARRARRVVRVARGAEERVLGASVARPSRACWSCRSARRRRGAGARCRRRPCTGTLSANARDP